MTSNSPDQTGVAARTAARHATDKADLVGLLATLGLPDDEDSVVDLLLLIPDPTVHPTHHGELNTINIPKKLSAEAMALSMHRNGDRADAVREATGLSEGEFAALLARHKSGAERLDAGIVDDAGDIEGLLRWAEQHSTKSIQTRAARVRTDHAPVCPAAAAGDVEEALGGGRRRPPRDSCRPGFRPGLVRGRAVRMGRRPARRQGDVDRKGVAQGILVLQDTQPHHSRMCVRRNAGMMGSMDAELFPRGGQEIAPGAVHLPDWLSAERQRELLEACREWARPPAGLRTVRVGGGVMSVKQLSLGWHWYPYGYARTVVDGDGAPVKPFPVWLGEWARRVVAAAGGEPAAEDPFDVALVNFYGPKARMGMHRDSDERSSAPVVSFSLGDACDFRFGNVESRNRPWTDVELRSGDAFVFGGPSRLAYHGVPRTRPGSGPAELGLDGRVNVTVRASGLR